MKTAFNNSNSNNKDNIATTTLLAVCLIALASGVFNNNQAVAKQAVAVQKLDTVVVTASRTPDAVLDTMVVTASRKISRA